MAQSTPIRRKTPSPLEAEFETEAERLIDAERARPPAEAVLRMRAFADMATLLTTEALVEIAVTVCVTRVNALRSTHRPKRVQ